MDLYIERMYRMLLVGLLCCLASFQTRAQFVKAIVAVDGFTCSMCALSVDQSIRRLDFVLHLEMDLNNNIAIIYFRQGREVSFRKLADKVYDSGFSVRYIQAELNIVKTELKDYLVYPFGESEYHFLDVGSSLDVEGNIEVLFLNKKLISKKEYTRWEKWIKEDIRKNGKNDKVYYVTLVHG
jgi:hypothetical protein